MPWKPAIPWDAYHRRRPDATTTLYNAKQLSSARYNYLINQLNIKSALGTLNEQDLVALNNTLGKTGLNITR